MFLIYIIPALFHKTIEECTKFLTGTYVTCHYQLGKTEVQVVFDNPQRLELSPKMVEKEQRGKKIVCNDNHTHQNIQGSLANSTMQMEQHVKVQGMQT